MEPTTYVQCPTCPLKRRNNRPQCKACYEAHIPLQPPGAPKKGPKPATQQAPPIPPIPDALKKGPKPVKVVLAEPLVPIVLIDTPCAIEQTIGWCDPYKNASCPHTHSSERKPPIPAIPTMAEKLCSYGVKCTKFGCTEPHPPERPEPVNPALKPCKFGITCGIFGCKKQHPEGHVTPVDPATKPCPCEAKFGFCCVKRNPTCLHPHKVSRVKKP